MLKLGSFTLHWTRHGKHLEGPPEYLKERYPLLVQEIRSNGGFQNHHHFLRQVQDDYECWASEQEQHGLQRVRAEVLREVLANDPIAQYMGHTGKRKSRLTQILRGTDFPETVTVAEATMLKMGQAPLQAVANPDKRIPVAYCLDELADHFGISETQLMSRIQAVKRMQMETEGV